MKRYGALLLQAWLLAFLCCCTKTALADVKIFIVVGDSNAVGRGDMGHLNELVYANDSPYDFLRTSSGQGFQSHPKVRITFNYDFKSSSPLVVGYETQFAGPGDTPVFGPELGFGWTVGEAYPDDEILIVKVAERGNKQGYDWLSPSSPLLNEFDEDSGFYWDLMTELVTDVLANLGNYILDANVVEGEKVEIAGIVSFMGWNDAFDDSVVGEFEPILTTFLDDLRTLFGSEIPIVIGELGQQGDPARFDNVEQIRQGQENVVDFFQDVRGDDKITFVPTHQFVIDDQEIFHNEAHFWGRADTFMNTGIALGEEMIRQVGPASTDAPLTPAPVTPAPTDAPLTPAPTDAPVTPAPTDAPTDPPTPSPTEPAATASPVAPPTPAPKSAEPTRQPTPAVITAAPVETPTPGGAATMVKVFLMLGDTTMAGRGNVDNLEQEVYKQNTQYEFLRTDAGTGFLTRDDVRLTFNNEGLMSSDLEVGFAQESDGPNGQAVFGPDIGFGWTVGDAIDDPVLIIKLAHPGSKQTVDWLSPGSGFLNDSGPNAGRYWDDMISQVDIIMRNLDDYVPNVVGPVEGEVTGVSLLMGWNDALDDATRFRFEVNLFSFVRDLQSEFGEFIPVIIGELGQQGSPATTPEVEFVRDGQESMGEFFGQTLRTPTISFLPTSPFIVDDDFLFDEENVFFGRADTYMDIGIAMGEEMLRLIDLVPDTESPTPAPTEVRPPLNICFSGDTTVVTKEHGTILMKDLALGDEVATSVSGNFERVYSFGHKHDTAEAEFLRIMPTGLELSKDHMIMMEGGQSVPAGLLNVGDRLYNDNVVASIESVKRQGAYAPFTASGALMVNNVLVSSYIAFQQAEHIQIGSVTTPFSYQWLAHVYQAPHRLWCMHVSECLTETYTAQGISTWVNIPLQVVFWSYRQSFAAIIVYICALAFPMAYLAIRHSPLLLRVKQL